MSTITKDLVRGALTFCCLVLAMLAYHHFRTRLPAVPLPEPAIYAPLIEGGYTPEEAREFFVLLPQLQLKAQETFGRDFKALSPDEMAAVYSLIKLPIVNQKVARGQPLTVKEQEMLTAWRTAMNQHSKP